MTNFGSLQAASTAAAILAAPPLAVVEVADPVQAALLKAMEAREGGARVARSAAWDAKMVKVRARQPPQCVRQQRNSTHTATVIAGWVVVVVVAAAAAAAGGWDFCAC